MLYIGKYDDWYDVSLLQVVQLKGFGTMRNQYDGLYDLLSKMVPDYPWRRDEFNGITTYLVSIVKSC
jgi:hypothetical protein